MRNNTHSVEFGSLGRHVKNIFGWVTLSVSVLTASSHVLGVSPQDIVQQEAEDRVPTQVQVYIHIFLRSQETRLERDLIIIVIITTMQL